jgi:hypothetical protein
MRFVPRFKTLTAEEAALVKDPEKRQLISYDINEAEAKDFFRQMPWALCLETPRFWWFRHDK